MGRLRRSVEQQELWHRFVDKLVEQKIGEEAAPAARRDESGPITLFGTAAASRCEPTGELGAAALDRAASEARAAADVQPTWQLQARDYLSNQLRRRDGAGQAREEREIDACVAASAWVEGNVPR